MCGRPTLSDPALRADAGAPAAGSTARRAHAAPAAAGRRRWAVAFGIVAGLLCSGPDRTVAAATATATATHAAAALQVDAPVPVPVRDGVHLSAWVYRPASTVQRLPVILCVTPYAIDLLHTRARWFAERGYAFVVVSSRGRGDSGGSFDPFSASDGADAADAVAWAAAQPWANGRVGMWGGSYSGYNQWAAAGHRPVALRTIVPAAAVFPGVDYPAYNGVNFSYAVQWLAGTSGRATHFSYAYDTSLWAARMRSHQADGGRFADLAPFAAGGADRFRQWALDPAARDGFAAAVPAARQWAGVDIPVLTITGSYDADQRGALEYHRRHLAARPPGQARHWLLFGPWDHAGTRSPAPVMHGVAVGAASVVDLNALHKAWYDWTLKDGPFPDSLLGPVTYHTAGEDRWRGAASLAAMGPHRWALHLAADGRADRVAGTGRLSPAEPLAAQQHDFEIPPVTAERAARTPVDPDGMNQDVALALDGDGLVYHSEPLTHHMTLAGAPALDVWLSIDRPDADLYASLHEVRSDGTAVLLSHDLLRARLRHGDGSEAVLRDDQPKPYAFRHFTVMVRQLDAGSRLRLVLHGNTPLAFERNHGHGGRVANERRLDDRPTRVRLHRGPGMPAVLHLPLTGPPNVHAPG